MLARNANQRLSGPGRRPATLLPLLQRAFASVTSLSGTSVTRATVWAFISRIDCSSLRPSSSPEGGALATLREVIFKFRSDLIQDVARDGVPLGLRIDKVSNGGELVAWTRRHAQTD
jgi:hypothetical protein